MPVSNDVRAGASRVKPLVALVAVAAVGVSFWILRGGSKDPRQQPAELPPYRPVPVQTNRGKEIPIGFRGHVHPMLHGKTRLDVSAHWTRMGYGRDQLERNVPPRVYELFAALKPETPQRVYTEHDFSSLMPEEVESVGQVWTIGLDDAARLLRQFHPHPSLHLVAFGRRAGPDGAFAILRAASPTHLDILFRIHAEFDIAENVWFTPACFWGRMVVNKETGTVNSFRMWIPTNNPLNVHLTVAESIPKGSTKSSTLRKIERGDFVVTKRDIVRVEQMELMSNDSTAVDELAWPESIDVALAQQKLKSAFYAFAEIHWVPWHQALAIAAEQKKPVLAVVLWGALDDQSC